MSSREGALTRAANYFDDGSYKKLLTDLVAIPSTAQEPGHEADLRHYLEGAIGPWLERLGFEVIIHPNPLEGFGPILTGVRIEDASKPTVLLYGHGDTVRGLDDQWRPGLKPWELYEEDGRWYGRGSADNKGQHALNIAALEAVLAERGGKLGFNVKIVLEMAEERGSRGLREFVAANRDLLAADVLIASDGPRCEPDVPTIATGTRGIFQFDLVLKLRPGGVHSGHWGGLTTDPAIRLSHAIGAICDARGKILVRDWLPQNGVPGEQLSPTQPIPSKPAPFETVGLKEDDLIDFTPELRAEALIILKNYTYGPLFTPPSLVTETNLATVFMPGFGGGANWQGVAFDPDTNMLYIPSTSHPMPRAS